MKEILLTQGRVALVSDHRFSYLNQWAWSLDRAGKTFYAVRFEGRYPFQRKIYMHREIMDAPTGTRVDHFDNDGLNNQDENLRTSTHSENLHNRGKQKNNTTGFKGVTKAAGKYIAQIDNNGNHIYLGSFVSPEEAARAYDRAARELHGRFAKTNF